MGMWLSYISNIASRFKFTRLEVSLWCILSGLLSPDKVILDLLRSAHIDLVWSFCSFDVLAELRDGIQLGLLAWEEWDCEFVFVISIKSCVSRIFWASAFRKWLIWSVDTAKNQPVGNDGAVPLVNQWQWSTWRTNLPCLLHKCAAMHDTSRSWSFFSRR